MVERSNEQWLATLRGSEKGAIADLRAVLVRGLRTALYGRVGDIEPAVEDFVQNALVEPMPMLSIRVVGS